MKWPPKLSAWAERLLTWSVTPVAWRSDRWVMGWLHGEPPTRPKPYPFHPLNTLPPLEIEGTTPRAYVTPAAVDDTGEDAYLIAHPSGVGWRHAWSCVLYGMPGTITPGWLTGFLGLACEQVRITQTVAVIPAPLRKIQLQFQGSLFRAIAKLDQADDQDEDEESTAALADISRVQAEVIHHEAQVFGVTTLVTLVGSEAEVAAARTKLTEWLETRDCEWRDLRQRHNIAFQMATLSGGVATVAHHRRRNTTAMAYSYLATGNGVDMGVGPYIGLGYGDADGQRIHYDFFDKAHGGPEAPSVVLCGPNGTGKTTLAIQIIAEYLQRPPNRRPWIRIVDPKGDYRIFAQAMGFISVVMTEEPEHTMNICDLPPVVDRAGMRANPVLEAVERITGFFVLVADRGGERIEARRAGILDRAILACFAMRHGPLKERGGIHRGQEDTWTTDPLRMPLLSDLEATLRRKEYGADGVWLADLISIYATGSLSGLFNVPTTVPANHPRLHFDIEGLGGKLQALVSYLIANTEWKSARRHLHPRIYLTDEVTQVLKYEESARLYGDIASMGRFFGVCLMTNGQLPHNWLNDTSNGEGLKVWENAPTKILMKQVPGESVAMLSRLHHLTAWDQEFLDSRAGVGDFLILAGNRGRAQVHCDPTDYLLSLMPKPATVAAAGEVERQIAPRVAAIDPLEAMGVG